MSVLRRPVETIVDSRLSHVGWGMSAFSSADIPGSQSMFSHRPLADVNAAIYRAQDHNKVSVISQDNGVAGNVVTEKNVR